MIEDRLSVLVNNETSRDFSNYTLEGIRKALRELGNPEKRFKSVHIAGTNGKGSVAVMVHDILSESGYRVGLYTSPHLLRINERIKINGFEITDVELEKILDEILAVAGDKKNLNLTWFDVLTVSAFLYFAGNNVDLAVIETGLGGRLDSTNVIIPLCSIITDISLDHTRVLGRTITDISREKAGIIKNNVPVITSNEVTSALEPIINIAGEVSSQTFLLNRDFHIRDPGFERKMYKYELVFLDGLFDTVLVELEDMVPVQIRNSALAVTSALLIQQHFPEINVHTIRNALRNCTIPGRFEKLSNSPLVYFDTAHNTSSITALFDHVRNRFGKKTTVIITLMKDKDTHDIMKSVARYSETVIYHLTGDDNIYDDVTAISSYTGFITRSKDSLLRVIREQKLKDTVLLFTGSFRLYGTALYCAASLKKLFLK